MTRLLVPSLALILLLTSIAQSASLTAGPSVKPEGAGARITFAVDQSADVEVAILDATGRVIRHLAAGVVGRPEAAPPLKAGSLSQSLLWDRLDDLGRPAAAKGNTLRVRLGMRVTFGRMIGGNPLVIDTPRGLATDAKGQVYLMSQSYRAGDGKSAGPRYLQVFDDEGKYLRTLMPYPASLRPDEVRGFGLIDAPGPLTPRNVEGVWPVIYAKPNVHLQPWVPDPDRIPLTDGESLYFLNGRGAAVDEFKGVPLWPADKPRFHYNRAGPLFMAFSPDRKRLYVAGPYVNPQKADAKMLAAWPKGRVYVLDLAKGGGAVPFVDVPTKRDRDLEVPDAARTLRRAPHGPVHGLATDAKGNLYVCDRANDRIVVFDPAGKTAAQIPLRQPHLVAVTPATGEVFVVTMRPLAYRRFETRLVKLAGLDRPEPIARMDLPAGARRPIMAIDASVRPAAVWLTGVQGSAVWRVEQQGDVLKATGRLPVSSEGALWGADRIAVDYQTDDVYINDGWSSLWRYNGLTGRGRLLGDSRALRGRWERDTNQRANLTATDAAVGPDGFVYLRNGPRYSGPITRWTRRMHPAPLMATNSHVFTKYIYSRFGAGYGERGFDIHPDGRVFVLSMYDWNKYFIHVFTPEGKPVESGRLKGQVRSYDNKIQSGLIGPLTGACGGLKVDAAGNVYAGMRLLPDGFRPPPGFEKDPAYNRLSGSVFKFVPSGGGVVRSSPKASQGVGIKVGRNFVAGAVKAYPDLAPFSGGYGSGCVCRNPRFDLDRYGRLYIPSALRYGVSVRDNAGNVILRFGQYDNLDAKGGGPTIPLGWPIAVGISRNHIYVSDMLNKRVVRADVGYAATETRAIPPGAALARKATEAEVHAKNALADAARLSPSLKRAWLAKAVALALTRQSSPATIQDARVVVCHMTRLIADWPAAEASALAKRYLADESPRVRLAALWAIDRDDMPDVTVTQAKSALADKDQRVRTLAAVFLLDRGHGDGLSVIFAGAMSEDAWVLDLARPAATEEVVVEPGKGPQYLRASVGAKEVDQVLRLLNVSYNNMRSVAAGVLIFCGDPRAPKALANRLAEEKISFVRRRLIAGLTRLRARAATAPLLANVADGAGSRKKGTGWQAAEALADLGDPASVDSLIGMLDQPKSKDLALFALSRAFDGQISASSDYRLMPDAKGKLTRRVKRDLPSQAEVRRAWRKFWDANKARYSWSDKEHPLRPKAKN